MRKLWQYCDIQLACCRVYWPGLLCPPHVRWSATDKENERARERERIMAPVDIRLPLMCSLAGCPALSFYSAFRCLNLTDLQSISGHSTDRAIMHCIMVSHCQPNTIFQQLDLIRNNTIDLLVQCIRPQIRPQKQYLLFMYFSPYFSQIPILIPLNS